MSTTELTCSVVIATRNRASELAECLDSLARQDHLPDETIVVDCSENTSTEVLVHGLSPLLPFSLHYERGETAHPGVQRNQGARSASSEILLFLDDDVILEPPFIGELLAVFAADERGCIAGVGGTITNQTFRPLSPMNEFIHRVFFGPVRGTFASNVIGPGLNFLPEDHPNTVQSVAWLNTTGTAYRREVFLAHGFAPDIQYPFDDLYLSVAIGRDYELRHTTRARLLHKDLGGTRKRNWIAFGESTLLGRHAVMTRLLERTRVRDYAQLLLYDLVYGPLAMLRQKGKSALMPVILLWLGRVRGVVRLARTERQLRLLLALTLLPPLVVAGRSRFSGSLRQTVTPAEPLEPQ